MKANNLTFSIPQAACTKDCPYCISKMTFAPDSDINMFHRNLVKAKNFAMSADIGSVLISSKGEPMNNQRTTRDIIKLFSPFTAVELQTNGSALVRNLNLLNILYADGLDTLALSIDKLEDFDFLHIVLVEAQRLGLIVRITVVLSDRFSEVSFNDIMMKCHLYGVKQLTFRKLTKPSVISANLKSAETAEWVVKHGKGYDHIIDRINDYAQVPSRLIRKLPFGMSVYDINGIGVTAIDYCIQESNNNDDIRSLIYHQDGHMYTSWDKPGSILF